MYMYMYMYIYIYIHTHTHARTVIVQMIAVRELPPRAGSRILVSLLSRYGICWLSPKESFAITLPRVSRDLLMLPPSFRR